ncbi:putative serine threonine-protein kinase tsua, partial [Lasius niger]
EAKMVAVGGDTFDKAIKRILSVIMTDELAGKCTWIIRKPDKTKISNYNFPNVISIYITKKYSTTDELVKKRIQLWLQKYGDRIKLKQEQARRDEEQRQREYEQEQLLNRQG